MKKSLISLLVVAAFALLVVGHANSPAEYRVDAEDDIIEWYSH